MHSINYTANVGLSSADFQNKEDSAQCFVWTWSKGTSARGPASTLKWG